MKMDGCWVNQCHNAGSRNMQRSVMESQKALTIQHDIVLN